jgi:DHA3 family macrolide efflux protein-like MFS transporter
VLLAPVAGALVDRLNRRLVMITADSLVALATLGLAGLFALGLAQPWHVYLAMLIRAAAGTFQFPAMQASTSLMVPPEHLSRVAGFNQTLEGAMRIVAPPIGALLLGVLPLQGVLAIDVLTALLGVTPLLFVRVPQPARQAPAPGQARPSLRGEMRAGLDYLLAWPGAMIIVSMAMVLNFLINPAVSLMPLLVTNHFLGGVTQLAVLNSAYGLAVVAGGLVLGVWGGFRKRVFTSLMGVVGLGLGLLVMGLAPGGAFWLAVVGWGLGAFMLPLANGPLFAVLQSTVAPEMQGRVFALIGALSTAISPLSLLVAGPVANVTGVPTWYVVAGAACILMGSAMFLVPAVTNLESQPKPAGGRPAEGPVSAAASGLSD